MSILNDVVVKPLRHWIGQVRQTIELQIGRHELESIIGRIKFRIGDDNGVALFQHRRGHFAIDVNNPPWLRGVPAEKEPAASDGMGDVEPHPCLADSPLGKDHRQALYGQPWR